MIKKDSENNTTANHPARYDYVLKHEYASIYSKVFPPGTKLEVEKHIRLPNNKIFLQAWVVEDSRKYDPNIMEFVFKGESDLDEWLEESPMRKEEEEEEHQ
jgi:hypothetical protein